MVNYVVQPGDTLWRIAQQFGVTPEAIAQENNLADPNLIFPGQILVIPTVGVPPAPPAPRPSPPPPMPPVVPPPGLRIYIVQPGDTLAEIAARYGVSVAAIARANNIANPDLIYVGQILVIPVAAPPRPPIPPAPPPVPPITLPPSPPVPPVAPPPGPPAQLPVRGNYSTRLEGGILYMLYTNRRVYRRGENVRIIFSKTNVQTTPITLEYRSGQQFDILITRAGEEVWRWSHGKVFTLIITQTTLAPGESQVFRELWTQVDNQGRSVPTGRYVVTAWNTSTNVEVTVDIEITE